MFEGYPRAGQLIHRGPSTTELDSAVPLLPAPGANREHAESVRAATRNVGPWFGTDGFYTICNQLENGPDATTPLPHPDGRSYYVASVGISGTDYRIKRRWIQDPADGSAVGRIDVSVGSKVASKILTPLPDGSLRLWTSHEADLSTNYLTTYDEDVMLEHQTGAPGASGELLLTQNTVLVYTATTCLTYALDWNGTDPPLDTETFTAIHGATFDGLHLWVFGTHASYNGGAMAAHVWDVDQSGGTFIHRGSVPLISDIPRGPVFDGGYVWWFYDSAAPTEPNNLFRLSAMSYGDQPPSPVRRYVQDVTAPSPSVTGLLFDGYYLRIGFQTSTGNAYISTLDPKAAVGTFLGYTLGPYTSFNGFHIIANRAKNYGGGLLAQARSFPSNDLTQTSIAIMPQNGHWQDAVYWQHPDGTVYRRGGYEFDGTTPGSTSIDGLVPTPTLVLGVTGSISGAVALTTSNRAAWNGLMVYNNGTNAGGSVTFDGTSIPFGTGILVGPTANYAL